MAFVCKKTLKGFQFAFPKNTNFEGRPTDYNRQGGKRYFEILLDDEQAEEMRDCGLDVKTWKSKYDEDDIRKYIKVNVVYKDDPSDKRNPIIWLVDNDTKKRTLQDAEIVGQIDSYARENRIVDATAIFTVSSYKPTAIRPEGGCSAYLDKMIIFFQPDDIDAMLAQFDDDNPYEEPLPF